MIPRIVRSVLAVSAWGTAIYMIIQQLPVPEWFIIMVGVISTFYFEEEVRARL